MAVCSGRIFGQRRIRLVDQAGQGLVGSRILAEHIALGLGEHLAQRERIHTAHHGVVKAVARRIQQRQRHDQLRLGAVLRRFGHVDHRTEDLGILGRHLAEGGRIAGRFAVQQLSHAAISACTVSVESGAWVSITATILPPSASFHVAPPPRAGVALLPFHR